ncbi:hypothetical protein LP420_36700 [Massilia sp. B-10]|nr:hypothetical protein LP420_36700 [Massilia sp. B-10]
MAPARKKGRWPDAAAANAAPTVNYWSTIAPLVAGSYGGKCLRPPSADAFQGAIVIAPDGKVSADDVHNDLRKADISLASTVDNDKPVRSMHAMLNDFTLMLADKGPQQGLVSMVASGDQAVACEHDMQAPGPARHAGVRAGGQIRRQRRSQAQLHPHRRAPARRGRLPPGGGRAEHQRRDLRPEHEPPGERAVLPTA